MTEDSEEVAPWNESSIINQKGFPNKKLKMMNSARINDKMLWGSK